MTVNRKQRAVIGMGKTGLSCARFLRSQGENFSWFDTRNTPPGLADIGAQFPDADFYCGELDAARLCDATEIIVSPGVSVMEPALQLAIKAGIPVVGDIELFVRATKKPVIAITGSNAKSTVTTLVGEMAAACGLDAGVGGNLGTPVLDMLAHDARHDCYVLELSSFQLETTFSLQAAVAIILNVSDDHMDRYANLQEYTLAKQRIYNNAQHVVFNRADDLTHPTAACAGRRWSFGLDSGDECGVGIVGRAGDNWLALDQHPLMRVADIGIAGKHNIANVAAALAVAKAAGWDLSLCIDAVRRFKGLPHRCQWVATINAVNFYNDSKGTNIGATVAAIEGLCAGKNVVLVAGGEGKGADFSQLAPVVQQHVRALVLIGRDAALIAKACDGVDHVMASSMTDAVSKAQHSALPGDVVVLSPACASFDMFDNYEDRGRQFCAAVEALV